jgi:hypothetical protein
MRWYIPSFGGDFRLEPSEDAGKCMLVIQRPTLGEIGILKKFLAKARKNAWTSDDLPKTDGGTYRAINTHLIELATTVAKAGAALVKMTRPKDRTLTAVKFENGRLETAVGTDTAMDTLAEKSADSAKAAVSVARPTPCCPQCYEGAIGPATEVLAEFMTDEQHADWAKKRAMIVHGGYTGRRYLLAHRNSAIAAKIGKICFDVDAKLPLHFHDSFLPPEEEVLATKLILEHHEDWLRNEATLFNPRWANGGYNCWSPPPDRFKNPFGDATDGLADAAMTSAIGGGVMGALYNLARMAT